jgi:PAS domain S-box-containing protein
MPAAPLPPSEPGRLAALRSYEILDADSEETFDSITRLAANLMGCPIALVSLLDTDRQWFLSHVGLEASETHRDMAFCGYAILEPSEPFVVADASKDPRLMDNALVTGRPDIRAYAGMPLVNPDGHALGTLCVIDRKPRQFTASELDILRTLAKTVMTTLELRRAMLGLRDAARAADERLSRMIDASPNSLVLVELDGRIKLVSEEAERAFGYKRAELLGQPVELLVPARYAGSHVAHRKQFTAELAYRRMSDREDLFARRKDGGEFPVEISLSPVEFEGEMFVLAGILDISERLALEQERERHRQELARSNADLEEFAYVAAHDLKAPLRGIANLAEWIAEDVGPSVSHETLQNLSLLRARVTRLQTLQDGLLAYARVGRINSEIEDVDIAELVADIAALLAPPAGFVVVCEDDAPTLRLRRAPLVVVLENLIANGIKHHDRAFGRITVSARQVDALMTEFRVKDDGPGIPPEFHDRIFGIFQTLDNREGVESSGIGLAIVKRQVEAHGGKIRIESAPPERGTTFVFTWKDSP